MVIEKTDDFPPPSGDGWKLVTDLRIADQRISMRDSVVERYGIELDDEIDMALRTDDGRRIRMDAVEVGSRRRVTVPSKLVNAHGLEGVYVDAWVRKTPEQADD